MLVDKEEICDDGQHDEADDHTCRSVTIERYAQQCGANEESYLGLHVDGSLVGLPKPPHECCNQENDIDIKPCVERHTHAVDKQEFKPSAHLHDARNHTIEYGCHNHNRESQHEQRAFQCRFLTLLVVEHQHHGWNTEKVEKVNTNRKTHKVRDEHQPLVAVRLVGIILPFQYQPEHQSGEE